MAGMRTLPAWALMVVFAAGCLGDDAATRPSETATVSGTPTSADGPAEDAFARPRAWAVGDWWEYRLEFPAGGEAITARIVAYADDGASWLVSTTDRTANLLSEFSHYPTLGPVDKQTLAGTIHGAEIPFFEWPLTDGASWTGAYRQADGTWTAAAAEQPTPRGDLAGFDITMQATTGESATYGYAAEVGWYTHLTFGFGPLVTAKMTLSAWGHNHTGPVSVLAFDEFVHRSFPSVVADAGAAGPPAGEATQGFVAAGDAPLVWGTFYGGAPGAYVAQLKPHPPATDAGAGLNENVDDSVSRFAWGVIDAPSAGSWEFAGSAVVQSPGGFLFGEVLEFRESPVDPSAP